MCLIFQGFGNDGLSLEVNKNDSGVVMAPIVNLRSTYKYPVYKVWFGLPVGENILFTVKTIGADGLPDIVFFEYDTNYPGEYEKSIVRGYNKNREKNVRKLPKTKYKKLEEDIICAEIEFTPFKIIFRYNGIETDVINQSVDNQQKLVISLLPTNNECKTIKPAFIRRIVVESKYMPKNK